MLDCDYQLFYLFSIIFFNIFYGAHAETCGRAPQDSTDKPWHVNIYRIDIPDVFVCFGTLISSRMFITSESCLYLFDSAIQRYTIEAEATHYEVTVNKLPRSQKSFKVEDIYILNKTGPMTDANRFHELMVWVLEEKITFNADVSPACINWTNSNRINVQNGLARMVHGQSKGGFVTNEEPRIALFSFSNYEGCSENTAYPYFVFYWASLSYQSCKKIDENFLFKKSLHCLVLMPEQLNVFTTGSGVLFEEDNKYFLRGVSSSKFHIQEYVNGSEHHRFKTFMNNVRYLPKFSYEDLVEDQSQKKLFEEKYVIPDKFGCLLKKHLGATPNWHANPHNLVGFFDIADYIDWIKSIRDEIEN